ncbi:MAG TPA: antitoxin Xre/MbcA/ParS toxin-binding domain-containing protein [Puia sp.]|jgi:putative toxin-antitoxin system antitoxin component (TIGR02293 family)|nr:antitoxin Xre/MbcA/ParS toxin-binding domain-containing protein [Puia sp.]
MQKDITTTKRKPRAKSSGKVMEPGYPAPGGKKKAVRGNPDQEASMVSEPAVAYGTDPLSLNATATPVTRLSLFQKMKMSETGISKKELEKLKNLFGLNYEQLAELLLVTKATLINKPPASKFNAAISERIISIWEIYSYGYAVFSEPRFREWLFRKNRALDQKAPFEFLHSSFGREEVKDLIGRIEYGVYS